MLDNDQNLNQNGFGVRPVDSRRAGIGGGPRAVRSGPPKALHPIATAGTNAVAGMRVLELSSPNLDEAKHALSCIMSYADRAKDIVGRIRVTSRQHRPKGAF